MTHDIDQHGYANLYDSPDYINLCFERTFSSNIVVTYRYNVTNQFGVEVPFKRHFKSNSAVKKFIEKEFFNKNKYTSRELNLWRRFGRIEDVRQGDIDRDNRRILKEVFSEDYFLDRIAATGLSDY